MVISMHIAAAKAMAAVRLHPLLLTRQATPASRVMAEEARDRGIRAYFSEKNSSHHKGKEEPSLVWSQM